MGKKMGRAISLSIRNTYDGSIQLMFTWVFFYPKNAAFARREILEKKKNAGFFSIDANMFPYHDAKYDMSWRYFSIFSDDLSIIKHTHILYSFQLMIRQLDINLSSASLDS